MMYYMFFFIGGYGLYKSFFFFGSLVFFGGWCMLIGVDQVKDRRN